MVTQQAGPVDAATKRDNDRRTRKGALAGAAVTVALVLVVLATHGPWTSWWGVLMLVCLGAMYGGGLTQALRQPLWFTRMREHAVPYLVGGTLLGLVSLPGHRWQEVWADGAPGPALLQVAFPVYFLLLGSISAWRTHRAARHHDVGDI